jgi:glycosyltransferase involved in cell wall biosynthesis
MTDQFLEISVIICTRNRSGYLQHAIDSITSQSISNDNYELIVVDNGSLDDTATVVEHASTLNASHAIRYVHEPRIGLSIARNTGSMNARGRYLAFLDDDALASPGWLEHILIAFNDVGHNLGCVGGKIDLVWEKDRPPWLHDALLGPLGKLDISQEPMLLPDGRYLFGGNFAIAKDLLEDMGGFDSHLGRRGNRLTSNEEVELQNRLMRMGYSRRYDPEILVYHHARVECLSRRWYLRRRFWQGVSESIEEVRNSNEKREHLWSCVKHMYKAVREMVRLDDQIPAFNSALDFSYYAGRGFGLLRSRKQTI